MPHRGGAPGTLGLIEASVDDEASGLEMYGTHPASVLRLVQALGSSAPRVLVVGCEPATVEPYPDGQITLSPPVNGAVDEAIRMIESLMSELVGTIGET